MVNIPEGYEGAELLGKGTGSTCYLARHTRLGQNRVIKCSSYASPYGELLKKEASILKNLSYPSIPIIYDTGVKGDTVYLVEEYCPGESLGAYILSCTRPGEDVIAETALTVCEVIEYLHSLPNRPLLYLDFKPEHLILNGNSIKLVDFGSAVFKGEISRPVGATKGFSAPEIFEGSLPDERADVFGIGALMFYMATGGETISYEEHFEAQKMKYEWNCNERLTAIIKKAVSRGSRDRYPSVAALKDELTKAREKKGEGASRTYEIAVVGTGRRVGTSHLAISLCCYLNHTGYDCVYYDEMNVGILEKIREYNKALKVKGDYYTYSDFKGCPTYGTAIEHEEYCADICVRDYGSFNVDITDCLYGADMIFLVCGSREWELEETEYALKVLRAQRNLCVVLNGTSPHRAGWFSAKYRIRTCLFPVDDSPFVLSSEKINFFDKTVDPDGGKRIEKKRRLFTRIKDIYCGWLILSWKRFNLLFSGLVKLSGKL